MTHRRHLITALSAGLLGACSPLAAFNTLTPRAPGVRRAAQATSYGSLPRQTLDVYLPRGQVRNAPVLVFFYGGGWEDGQREDYAFAGRAFAARGFVTLDPDYRRRQEAPYPAFLQDCAAAVAWAQTHAAEYGGDGRRLVLAGHSAGAYNAAMLALDPRWLREAQAPYPVAGWAGISGPYDFLPLSPGSALRTFGGETDPAATQPISHASAGALPAFLATGGKDTVVNPRNTARLAARLAELNVPVQARVYPGLGHAETVLALAWPVSLRAPVLREAADFLMASAGGHRAVKPSGTAAGS
jgi:acetyl esterase/lipase